jgi:hypothetical protein
MFVHINILKLSLTFESKARVYPRRATFRVGSRPCPQILHKVGMAYWGQNTLSYSARTSVTRKSFITSTPGYVFGSASRLLSITETMT